MDANNARNDELVRSSRFLSATRNEGSCGNGASGCMYVKKSSTKSSRVASGNIDSADRTACEENDANVAATLFGDVGEE